MPIFCIEDFKKQFEKLIPKNSYKGLESEIIDYFFGKPIKDLCSGTRLNNNSENPYIKKRLKGRGGFRCYFLILIKNELLYLMFVHPKTGSMGASNLNDKSRSYLYKEVLECIKQQNLYSLRLNDEENKILFERVPINSKPTTI